MTPRRSGCDPNPPSVRPKLFTALKAALIASACAWAYWPAMRGGWLWDDTMYIVDNPLIRSPGGLGGIWFGSAGASYYPITETVRWAQWQLWGNATFGYHLTNLGLHLLGALLFWRLLGILGVRRAWLGGLIFAVHPLAVESVAWISELKNTLSLPLLLLATLAYLRWDAAPPGRRGRPYALAVFWFAAAMLCKTAVVMFPVTILLYAWWKRRAIRWADVAASLPFFAVSLGLGLVTVWLEHTRVVDYQYAPREPLAVRAAAAGLAEAFYLGKSLLPTDLMPIYPRWALDPPLAVQWLPWPALAVLAAWFYTKREGWGRHALLGLGWFVITLAPVLGFIGIAYLRLSRVADHFAYVPLLGLVGLAVAAMNLAPEEAPKRSGARVVRVLALAVPIALAGVFAAMSRAYAEVFRDEATYWGYTVTQNPGAWIAHYNLAKSLREGGRLDEAIAHYEAALRAKPDLAEAEDNLGVTLTNSGRNLEAIAHYEAAIRIQPDFPEAHDNLGVTLTRIGRLDEAVAHLERALELAPRSAEGHNNLGLALAGLERWDEAIAHYQAAIRIRPGLAAFHRNLASALRGAGKIAEAMDELARAQELEDNSPRP